MLPSRKVLLSLVAAYALAGVAIAHQSQVPKIGRAIDFLLGVATVIAIYVWCRVEAAERGSFAPGRSALWSAIFPLIFLPVYFFRTRQARSALALSVKAYAFYFLLSLLTFATALAFALIRGT